MHQSFGKAELVITLHLNDRCLEKAKMFISDLLLHPLYTMQQRGHSSSGLQSTVVNWVLKRYF